MLRRERVNLTKEVETEIQRQRQRDRQDRDRGTLTLLVVHFILSLFFAFENGFSCFHFENDIMQFDYDKLIASPCPLNIIYIEIFFSRDNEFIPDFLPHPRRFSVLCRSFTTTFKVEAFFLPGLACFLFLLSRPLPCVLMLIPVLSCHFIAWHAWPTTALCVFQLF